jgi:phage shock protein E
MNRIFIDVREPSEFARDHVNGAINLPPSEIMSGAPALNNVDKNTELVLYCLSGNRSNAYMHYLRELGFTNLVNGINKDQIRAKYNI